MASFRLFVESQETSEEQKNIMATLQKIPPKHAALVKGFQWKFTGGNTLNGDDSHVGYMDDRNKVIAVAAPWNYGREFTVLHEIAHKVWNILPSPYKQKWSTLLSHTKDDQARKINSHIQQGENSALNQNDEEIFCMVYAAAYVKNPPVAFANQHWIQFIRELPV